MVCVMGAVGLGKTRLAVAVAQALVAEGMASKWIFVDVADLREAKRVVERLPSMVADGGELQSADSAVVVVVDHVDDAIEDPLLIPLLMGWLASRPGCRLIATSRRRLDGSAVNTWILAPLDVDDSVRLLGERALAVGAGGLWSAGLENASLASSREALRRLAGLLGGVPLALERCAALAPILTPQEAYERLNADITLLDRAPQDVPGRHQSFAAAVDDAVATVDESSLRLWSVCGAFGVPFGLEHVERLVHGAALPDLKVDIIRGLANLVDSSLVQPMVATSTTPGPQHFVLLGPLRLEANRRRAALLGPAGAAAIAASRQRWLVDVAPGDLKGLEERAPALEQLVAGLSAADIADLPRDGSGDGGGDGGTEASAEASSDASDEAEEHKRVRRRCAVRAGWHLVQLARHRGPLTSIPSLVARLLPWIDDPVLRARFRLERARAAVVVGSLDEARLDLDAADADLPRVGAGGVGDRYRTTYEEVLALVARAAGDPTTALAHLHAAIESVRHQRKGGHFEQGAEDDWGSAPSATLLVTLLAQEASIAFEQGDATEAAVRFRAALQEARSGADDDVDDVTLGVILTNLALVLQETGAFADAHRFLEESLVLHRRAGNRRFEAIALGDSAGLHLEEGRPSLAAPLFAAGARLAASVGDLRQAALMAHGGRLSIALVGGNTGEALDVSVDEVLATIAAPLGADVMSATDLRADDPLLRAAHILETARRSVLALVQASDDGEGPDEADEADEADNEAQEAGTVGPGDAFRALDEARGSVDIADEVRLALRHAHRIRQGINETWLVVAVDGSGFRVGAGPWTSLARKPLLGRLLATLSAAAWRGESVPAAALVAAGWPGEKMSPASSQNRLAVALRTAQGRPDEHLGA